MKLCRFLHPRPVTGGPQRQPVQAEGGNNGVALLRSLCAAVALVACALWLSNPADVIAQAGQPTDASYEVGCGGPPGPGCPEGCTPWVEIDPKRLRLVQYLGGAIQLHQRLGQWYCARGVSPD
jgi:hypothetical protein